MSLPLVSIIIPTYNVEKYIEEGVNSLLSQTYPNLEILVIDDCSTDNTVGIVKERYSGNQKISLIEKLENSGPAISRNIGIRQAKGKYIALLDGDDYYKPSKIEKQIHVMEKNPDIVVCSTFLQCFGLQSNIVEFPVDHSEIKDQQLIGCPVAHPATMFRTSFLKENYLYYDENLRFSEDYEFFIRILEKGGKFVTIPEPLLFYRITGSQASFVQDKEKIIRNEKQWEISKELHYRVLNSLLNKESELLYDEKWVDAFLGHQVIRNFQDLKPFITWAEKLIQYNKKNGELFNSKFLEKVYKKSVLGYFLAKKKLSWKVLFQYLMVYSDCSKMKPSYQIKYIVKCLLFLKH